MDNEPSPAAPPNASLERAQGELRALLDAAVDAVIVINHEGRIATFNRAAERLFGHHAAEVVGAQVDILMPEPHRSGHAGYLRNYLSTGQARIIGIGRDVLAQRRDGTVFPASLAVGEIPGSDPPRFVAFIHDISSRQAATDALRRERDRAQSYVDLAQVMLVAVDGRGRIGLINPKGCEILGYAESELVGQDWFETCVPERQRATARAALAAALAGEAAPAAYAEDSVLTRDGSTKLIAWHATLVHDERGLAVGLLNSGEDISEQRDAERALKRSESLLRAAQAIAHLGNFEAHLPDGALYWSEQMYAIVGRDAAAGPLSPQEFAARCVHEDDRERYQRDWQRALADTGKFDLEYRLLRADGSTRAVHSRAQIVPAADGVSLVVTGTVHDITDHKLAAEELRQSQERLTHVARLSTMGEMAAGLAHEINQPLTAIANYSQLAVRLIDRGAAATTEELREPLVQITAQALRAGEIIRRLRTFVSNRAAHTEAVDVNRLLEELRVLSEPDARINDVRLTIELTPALPAVAADPVQLQQVLLNLIRNAIDATLDARCVPREVLVRGQRVDEGVELAVIDRGAGISDEVAAQLYNPFFTTKKEGTGLGLAISRSIIRAHRGKLGHRPTPGGGTTFYFTLPPLPGA